MLISTRTMIYFNNSRSLIEGPIIQCPFYFDLLLVLFLIFFSPLMNVIVAEDEVPPFPEKKLPKSKWDDEDVDDNDVKESWEDEDEDEDEPPQV